MVQATRFFVPGDASFPDRNCLFCAVMFSGNSGNYSFALASIQGEGCPRFKLPSIAAIQMSLNLCYCLSGTGTWEGVEPEQVWEKHPLLDSWLQSSATMLGWATKSCKDIGPILLVTRRQTILEQRVVCATCLHQQFQFEAPCIPQKDWTGIWTLLCVWLPNLCMVANLLPVLCAAGAYDNFLSKVWYTVRSAAADGPTDSRHQVRMGLKSRAAPDETKSRKNISLPLNNQQCPHTENIRKPGHIYIYI